MFPLINVGTTNKPKLGHSVITEINGSEIDILQNYQFGLFDVGVGENENISKARKVEFIDVEIPIGVAI